MKLLLDEMFAPELARQLRHRGHEVEAVGERVDLSGKADSEVLATAAREGHAVLTEDVSDYTGLAQEYVRDERHHHGIVLTSAARFTRRREGFGRLVSALETFLAEHADDDSLIDQVRWLE